MILRQNRRQRLSGNNLATHWNLREIENERLVYHR